MGRKADNYKEVDLPADVDPKISKAKYTTNGVLEVGLTKIKKPSSETIKIES